MRTKKTNTSKEISADVKSVGRPTGDGYVPEMAAEFIQLRANGLTITETIWTLGNKYGFRSRTTFYSYKQNHKDLEEAFEWGYVGYQAQQERLYRSMASGAIKGDSKAQLMLLNNTCKDNSFGDGWNYNPNGANVTINGNINQQIMQLSTDELTKRIADFTQKMNADERKTIDVSKEEAAE